jgi:hypothetical protein
MNSGLNWQYIKDFYKEHFGIDGWVVELFANFDILLLCSSGVSNKHIEEFLDIPLDEISKVIKDAFGFDGWVEDFPINPYRVFNDIGEEKFIDDVRLSLTPYIELHSIDLNGLLAICKTMNDIEERINDEWV